MSVAFKFLELEHYDNEPHFRRFERVREARRRECTILLPGGAGSQRSFDRFLQRLVQATERGEYLPVARFCDGEYSFYAGKPTTTCWGERGSDLSLPGVEERHVAALREISTTGFICPNLNLAYVGLQSGFLEYLSRQGMPLQNYAPFYFVYALLVNPRFLEALKGRRVALVTTFRNKNLEAIGSALASRGIENVEYHDLPSSGVAHGNFQLELKKRPDLALVGAGIGSPLVLHSLRGHSCPCIDSGFVFHLWDGTFDRFERLFLNYVE